MLSIATLEYGSVNTAVIVIMCGVNIGEFSIAVFLFVLR